MNTKKVILITGASTGIGKATAQKLAAEGHIVYASVRKKEQFKKIKEIGANPVLLDVTDFKASEKVVKKIITQEGKIDVLFNNAGFALYGSVEDVTIDEARYQFEVNVFGLARLTQLILPHMRKQNSGKIINVSSIAGKIYTPLGSWYHATKHAIEGWSDSLRLEVKQFGIKVVIIEPGAIKTEFGNTMMKTLLKKERTGAYDRLLKSYEKAMVSFANISSDPSVIANVVSKAIATNKPKTRYVAGKMASLFLFVRKWFSDKFFDKFVMLQIEKTMKQDQ